MVEHGGRPALRGGRATKIHACVRACVRACVCVGGAYINRGPPRQLLGAACAACGRETGGALVWSWSVRCQTHSLPSRHANVVGSAAAGSHYPYLGVPLDRDHDLGRVLVDQAACAVHAYFEGGGKRVGKSSPCWYGRAPDAQGSSEAGSHAEGERQEERSALLLREQSQALITQ